MGKHKKSTQNQVSSPSEAQNSSTPPPPSSSTTNKIKNPPNLEADYKTKMDLLTSQLLDLCSQKVVDQQKLTNNLLFKEYLEIRRKVDEIRQLQKSTSVLLFQQLSTSSNREENLIIMIDWCRKFGLRADGVTISSFGDDLQQENFGLRTEKLFEAGDLCLKVPRKLFLSLENLFERNDTLKSTFELDPMLKGMPNVALSLLIVLEKLKGPDSFWSSYINSLPTNYLTPLYFLIETDHEKLLNNLRGSSAYEETLKLYKNIVRQYAYFYQMLTSSSTNFKSILSSGILTIKSFVFDLYLWATVTVMTRINFVPSIKKENGMVPALIPFFDMANHGDVPPCTDFLDDQEQGDQQYAVIYASKSYQLHDQLLIYYGDRKYWEFFVHNGFVYDDQRRYPNCIIKLGLSSSDRLFKLKTSLLEFYGLKASEQFQISKYDHRDESKPLILKLMEQFARIFCSTEMELESLANYVGDKEKYEWSINTIDEARRFLQTRLSLLLRTYSSTTIINNNDLVNIDKSTTNVASAINDDDQERRRLMMDELVSKFIRGEYDALKNTSDFFERQHEK